MTASVKFSTEAEKKWSMFLDEIPRS